MTTFTLSSFVLFVSDITMSKEFYKNLLNQEITVDINNINVGFKSGLALWEKKYATNVIFENQSEKDDGKRNLEIYFETNHLDDIYRRMIENKVNFIHHIKIQPWQQRVFRIFDPDNFIVEIAESMTEVIKRLLNEKLTIDEIAEKTFMPKEVIQSLVNN